jgi:hypothetical protein
LKDLKLKSNVLDILDLPLTMRHGTIGTLKIEVRIRFQFSLSNSQTGHLCGQLGVVTHYVYFAF